MIILDQISRPFATSLNMPRLSGHRDTRVLVAVGSPNCREINNCLTQPSPTSNSLKNITAC